MPQSESEVKQVALVLRDQRHPGHAAGELARGIAEGLVGIDPVVERADRPGEPVPGRRPAENETVVAGRQQGVRGSAALLPGQERQRRQPLQRDRLLLLADAQRQIGR